MRYLVFLVCLAVGSLFIIKTDAVERTTGKIGWAERNLGGAGTNTFYKLLGLAIIIIGMMAATGLFQKSLGAILDVFLGNVKDSGQE